MEFHPRDDLRTFAAIAIPSAISFLLIVRLLDSTSVIRLITDSLFTSLQLIQENFFHFYAVQVTILPSSVIILSIHNRSLL